MDAYYCENCHAPITGRPGSSTRGRDVAWFMSCPACSALAEKGIKRIKHSVAIDIWECKTCGARRSCRPGWRTRCPVCLDDRTQLTQHQRALHDGRAKKSHSLRLLPAPTSNTPLVQVRAKELITRRATEAQADLREALALPGWTYLASDICGLPWEPMLNVTTSHGSWAVHDVCGKLQKINIGHRECVRCPPEQGSRTFRAKAAQQQYLYLVHQGGLLKFGHGTGRRISAHRAAGCSVVQVLRAPHADVVKAELALKRELRAQMVDPAHWDNVPDTFGTCTEVVEDTVDVQLSRFLPHATDVTNRWA